jgi:hypothetical protein
MTGLSPALERKTWKEHGFPSRMIVAWGDYGNLPVTVQRAGRKLKLTSDNGSYWHIAHTHKLTGCPHPDVRAEVDAYLAQQARDRVAAAEDEQRRKAQDMAQWRADREQADTERAQADAELAAKLAGAERPGPVIDGHHLTFTLITVGGPGAAVKAVLVCPWDGKDFPDDGTVPLCRRVTDDDEVLVAGPIRSDCALVADLGHDPLADLELPGRVPCVSPLPIQHEQRPGFGWAIRSVAG